MRGIPDAVWVVDSKIMVKLNRFNMPMPESECKRLFGRVPATHEDALALSTLYKSNTKGIKRLMRRERPQAQHWELRFDNIRTKGQSKEEKRQKRLERKKSMEAGIVKIELNKVKMKEGREYPTYKDCMDAAIEFESSLVERELTEKDELNLKFNIGGNRCHLDKSGMVAALPKIIGIMAKLGIDEATKITHADQ